MTSSQTSVYASLGRVLHVFALDEAGGLAPRQSLTMPQVVQYAWPNRARTLLYVATSGAGPMAGVKQAEHYVQVFRIAADGTLAPHQPALTLGNRPLHLSLDPAEAHLLIAYNDPPDVTVHAIAEDGRIAGQVEQEPIAWGPTVHQVVTTPPGTLVLVPACAHSEDGSVPGSVAVLRFAGGKLTPFARMEADPARAAPWRGVRFGAQGFAARHFAFHPTRPWAYLCVERQGELRLYGYAADSIELQPRAIASTLEGVPAGRSAQLTSAVHVHPNGRTAYVGNRAHDTETVEGRKLFVGGVNDIAVFALDAETGVPTLIQHADTGGIFPRTFGIDGSGRFLVAGNEQSGYVADGGTVRRVVPGLVVFRIDDDGRLTPGPRHDFPDNGEVCFWVDVLTRPARA